MRPRAVGRVFCSAFASALHSGVTWQKPHVRCSAPVEAPSLDVMYDRKRILLLRHGRTVSEHPLSICILDALAKSANRKRLAVKLSEDDLPIELSDGVVQQQDEIGVREL